MSDSDKKCKKLPNMSPEPNIRGHDCISSSPCEKKNEKKEEEYPNKYQGFTDNRTDTGNIWLPVLHVPTFLESKQVSGCF